jgi:hypothetical protein
MPEIKEHMKDFRPMLEEMIKVSYDCKNSDGMHFSVFEMYNDAVIRHLEALRNEFKRIDEMAEFI